MRNIFIAIIIGLSLIMTSLIILSERERYKIVMNTGGETAGILTIKYNTVTGKTWRLALPQNHWVEIKDYGRSYPQDDFTPAQ